MFELDQFLDDCRTARADGEPRQAISDLLRRTVSSGDDVADVLRPSTGGITVLERADDLTVLHVVWAPGTRISAHDHKMWAAIAIYGGQEDNAFYRRAVPGEPALQPSGGKQLADGDVLVLGDDVIHAVVNPLDRLTGAIHVYGGDLTGEPRSQWDADLRVEEPYDMVAAQQHFERANAALATRSAEEP